MLAALGLILALVGLLGLIHVLHLGLIVSIVLLLAGAALVAYGGRGWIGTRV